MKTNISINRLLILILILNYSATQAQCQLDDWTALNALYESNYGDNWTNKGRWDVQIANVVPHIKTYSEKK